MKLKPQPVFSSSTGYFGLIAGMNPTTARLHIGFAFCRRCRSFHVWHLILEQLLDVITNSPARLIRPWTLPAKPFVIIEVDNCIQLYLGRVYHACTEDLSIWLSVFDYEGCPTGSRRPFIDSQVHDRFSLLYCHWSLADKIHSDTGFLSQGPNNERGAFNEMFNDSINRGWSL